MRGQIDQLIETAALPNVKLQVIPFALYAHEGMYGPFQLFRFPHQELQDIVYIENVLGAFLPRPVRGRDGVPGRARPDVRAGTTTSSH